MIVFLLIISAFLGQALAFHHAASLQLTTRRFPRFPSTPLMAFEKNTEGTRSEESLSVLDFDDLDKISERTERLHNAQKDYMLSFYSDKLKSFLIVPNKAMTRPSVMSTCSALKLILNNKDTWKEDVVYDAQTSTSRISIKNTINTMMNADWTMDPMQTPLLVETLAKTRSINKDDPRYVAAVNTVLEQRARLSLHRQQKTSSYLRYQHVIALLSILENDMVPSSIANGNAIVHALERANYVAYDELSRQLAFYYSNDSSHFDVIILGFTLLTYYQTSHSLYLSSWAKGVVPYTNMELVTTAMKVIFHEQYADGSFRKGEPIFSSSGKRDIGNSYVFFFDLMIGMLDIQPRELLIPYIKNFERCLHWAETNILSEMLPVECDEETGRCTGPYVNGWKSNHINEGGAACWSTASVFAFVDKYNSLLRNVISDSVLDEFSGTTREDLIIETGSRFNWDKLMDADCIIDNNVSSLKDEIFNRVLLPQLVKEVELERAMLSPYHDNSKATQSEALAGMPTQLYNRVQQGDTKSMPLYSMILFGPPGTAKTTLCQNMASIINYNFVTIDTADFLADGLTNIASRMTYIFEKLKRLRNTVILFDEIEEFCLDRENPALAMESRLLTTAMLTQLNSLRREQENIFIIATNRLRSFDAAVIRPGRFDLLLFVGTPNLSARKERLYKKCSDNRIENLEEVLSVVHEYLDGNWSELRFLTFAENESFCNQIISLCRNKQFSKENIEVIVQNIMRTATIQGPVKQEYIETEVLSRL